MLSSNLKIYLAGLAFLLAIGVLASDRQILQGTGLIVATLAAGGAWLVRDVIDGQKTLVTICQAYAALIESQFEEVNDALSDGEVARLIALAPGISAGTEAEAVGARAPDPFALLPDVRSHLHLLSPDTVRYLWKWQARGQDLMQFYDEIGSKRWSAAGPDRLQAQFEWLKRYRDEYRDIGYTALKCLAADASNLKIDVRLHEEAGARRLSNIG